jgi:filamentous hemagglutinin family protein
MELQMTALLRSRLLAGAAAFGLLSLPAIASGQAFNGNHVTVFGSITRSSGPGTDFITVDTPSAVVNWFPNSNAELTPFDFLPAGTTATFQNGAANENFIILNRILPDNGRPIAFNGNLISQLKTAAGTVPGGTIVFYTPGGILIGGKASFNVGNLLLTTIDPVVDGNGNFFVNNTYELNSQAIDSKSFVRIDPAVQINAPGAGSYVAAAAPIIQQFGTVRVNGSVAYVAAEQVRLTIDSGLFDIEVKVGSSSAPATIDHRGSTGGPASDGFGDNHVVYMVAVPKNDAISLLLRGNVGYDVAADATEVNGAIILSAGYDVALVAPTSPSPVAASIDIRQASVTSNLIGFATEDAIATAFGGEALSFAGDVILVAPEANLGSEGGPLTVGGNAVVTSGRGADFNFNAPDGGLASIFARGGGTVQIAGAARVSASTISPAGQNANGGTAMVSADNGAIAIGSSLLVEAEAEGGTDGLDGPGSATGGTARIAASNGGTVTVSAEADVTASATGGSTSPLCLCARPAPAAPPSTAMRARGRAAKRGSRRPRAAGSR